MTGVTAFAPNVLASLVGMAATSLVNAFFGELTNWVSVGAAAAVRGAGEALESTTAVPINGAFMAVFALVRQVGAALVTVFLGLAVLQAVIRRDLGDLGRMLLIRLPIALIGAGVALEVVVLALQATNSLSGSILGSSNSFASGLASLLESVGSGPTGGFEALVVALLACFVAFMLWVELIVRSSAIAIAALFIPLALTGAIWSATTSWARRLAEMLTALIFSKLVIAAVFALAVKEIGEPTGISGLIQGVALILLATFSPWALFRLVPVIEAGAVTHLDGVASRATRALGHSAGPLGDFLDAGMPDFVPSQAPSAPMAEGKSIDTPEYRSLVTQFERDILSRGALSPDGSGSEGNVSDAEDR